MTTKNYIFGAFEPTANLKSVLNQMYAAHQYRNKLVELERTRREASEATIRRISPEYGALAETLDATQRRVDAAYEAVSKSRAKARARIPATAEQDQEIADAKAARNAAIDNMKAAKRNAYQTLQERQAECWLQAESLCSTDDLPQLAELKKTAATAKIRKLLKPIYSRLAEEAGVDGGQSAYDRNLKLARANCGCFWGTYLTIEDAASEFHKGSPPNFKRYEGDGTIAVQLQGGLTTEDAVAAKDTRLQIELANASELAGRGKSGGVRARGLVRMRIDSDGRKPIWTEFRATFHRPLPDEGSIRWAYLHRTRIGTHYKWSLRLTITDATDNGKPAGRGVAAIHPGWRIMPDNSIRAATVIDTDGHVEEFCLPVSLLDRHEKPDSLLSIRDRVVNRRATRLIKWLQDNATLLPEWLTERTATISQWQASSRFAQLCLFWRDNRFAGDELVYGLLERWRKQDKHLYDWQEHQRKRLERQRKDLYRNFANRMARTYAQLILPKINYQELRKRAAVDEETTQTDRQRRVAAFVSPGKLMECVTEAAAGRITLVDAKHITDACFRCEHLDKWDRRYREHTCTQCGARWDQDHNAAKIQLARGLVQAKLPGPLASQSPSGVKEVSGGRDEASNNDEVATTRKSRRNRRATQQQQ